jgi:hypothetical protein
MEERIIAADPVADPQGYQQELLGLLGTSDPLEVLAATPAAIQQRTTPLAGEALGRRPAAGEWSVAELVGHLWDAEIVYGFRARMILTRDRAPLRPCAPPTWCSSEGPRWPGGTDSASTRSEGRRAFTWPPRPSPAMTGPTCCSSTRPSPRCSAEPDGTPSYQHPAVHRGVDRTRGGMS